MKFSLLSLIALSLALGGAASASASAGSLSKQLDQRQKLNQKNANNRLRQCEIRQIAKEKVLIKKVISEIERDIGSAIVRLDKVKSRPDRNPEFGLPKREGGLESMVAKTRNGLLCKIHLLSNRNYINQSQDVFGFAHCYDSKGNVSRHRAKLAVVNTCR